MEHRVQPLPLEGNDAGESACALCFVCSSCHVSTEFLITIFLLNRGILSLQDAKPWWDLQRDGDLGVRCAGAGGGHLGRGEEGEDQWV